MFDNPFSLRNSKSGKEDRVFDTFLTVDENVSFFPLVECEQSDGLS